MAWEVPLDRVVLLAQPDLVVSLAPAALVLVASVVLAVPVELAARAAP